MTGADLEILLDGAAGFTQDDFDGSCRCCRSRAFRPVRCTFGLGGPHSRVWQWYAGTADTDISTFAENPIYRRVVDEGVIGRTTVGLPTFRSTPCPGTGAARAADRSVAPAQPWNLPGVDLGRHRRRLVLQPDRRRREPAAADPTTPVEPVEPTEDNTEVTTGHRAGAVGLQRQLRERRQAVALPALQRRRQRTLPAVVRTAGLVVPRRRGLLRQRAPTRQGSTSLACSSSRPTCRRSSAPPPRRCSRRCSTSSPTA